MFKLEAIQASMVYKYRNIKMQLFKTNSHIKFNRLCLKNDLIPKYAIIHIKSSSIAAINTKKHAEKFRIRQEIKSLYVKKTTLNTRLFKLHLQIHNNIHPAIIDNIMDSVNNYIFDIMRNTRLRQSMKIGRLMDVQHPRSDVNCKHTFYPRTSNLTSIVFEEDELNILNKGINYNFPPNYKHQVLEEVICAETAVKAISDPKLQNEARYLINSKFKNAMNKQHRDDYPSRITQKQIRFRAEFRTLMKIKTKLNVNNARITKADKGHTLVVIDNDLYTQKINEFISDNKIKILKSDPTDSFVKILNNTINKCTNLFDERTRRYLKPIHAKAPMLTGLPKIHKDNIPIRPLVNFTTAPGFKTAKKLVKVIKDNILLKNNYSIVNNTDFVNKIRNIKLLPNYKMASFDIVNLYTNIPVTDTLGILRDNLCVANKLNTQIIDELIALLEIVLRQNYFTFNTQFFIQDDGLAMGSPLSGLLADIYLNFYENSHILSNNSYASNIIFYGRYVDDTFLIFNGTSRQIVRLKNNLNNLNCNIQFTLETEVDNQLHFLDLTVTRHDNSLKFKVYRKPTTTDVTIHADSHHPFSQKIAAYNSFVHRLLSIPLDVEDFDIELNVIKHVAVANGYKSSLIDNILRKHIYKKSKPDLAEDPKTKTFISTTYTSVMPSILQSTFNKFDIVTSFKTNNSLWKLVRPGIKTQLEAKTGVYKLICNDCDSFYIGQTGRPFAKRFREHTPRGGLKNTYSVDHIKSNFARHLICNNHNYTDIRSNLIPLHYCNKGRRMDALEEFEIYRGYNITNKRDGILNDKLNFKSNPLYDTVLQSLDDNNAQGP